MRGLLHLLAPAAIVALGVGARPALAEDTEPRPVGGAFVGGLSTVILNCDIQTCFEPRTAGVVDTHVGVMVAPRLAVVLDGWGTSRAVGDLTLTAGQLVAGVRMWPWQRQRVWLQGGVGAAGARVTQAFERVDMYEIGGLAPAWMAAVGYEIVDRERTSVALHLRAATTARSLAVDATTLSFGVALSF